MKFGPVPLEEAEGAINAHSVRTRTGKIPKGKFIDADDIAALRASGVDAIIVARLEFDDIHEDEAAKKIAIALGGDRTRVADAFTGRVNLFAEASGVLVFDTALVDAVNVVHESVTLATLPSGAKVSEGQMIATIKIIPFAVSNDVLAQVLVEISTRNTRLSVAPFKTHKVGLVATRVVGTPNKMLDKSARLLSARLARLGSSLGDEIRCAHEEKAIADAISKLVDSGHEPVIVFGASATVDRRDMVPSGIVVAGGKIDHFGMPVDPGNLLLIGHLGKVRVLGAPGCARSPAENGFDRVLEQMMAGQPVTRQSIVAMGAGGLYKEIHSRPQPRTARPHTKTADKLRFAVIVLAAGQSRRMGPVNKLLQEIDGKTMVRHVVEAAHASGASTTLAVTGHERERIADELSGLDITFVHNADYAEGLSASLKAGVAGLGDAYDGFLVCLGDMPGISAQLLDDMMAAYDPDQGRLIIVPVFQGKRGNPVLFSNRFRDAMADLGGDMGAKYLIGRNEDVVFELEAGDTVLQDIDTPEALATFRDHRE
jgi:molybdenum cofactor cytidylyltransferase